MEDRNKDRFTWKNFLESKYYNDLCKFFCSLKNKWEENPNVVFVFVSRRAFCVFLLMKKMGKLNGWDDITVYADRYIMKNLKLNKIAARWPAKAVAQFFTFSKKGSDRIVPR